MTGLEQTFPQKLDELVTSFLNEERQEETNAEIAISIFEFVLNYERLRHQVTAGTDQAIAVDEQTISRMKTWDSNDPSMSTLEKVLRRLAEGRGEEGVNLLKSAIQRRAQEFSKRQTEAAKRPRLSRQQPMSGLVEQVVCQHPTISQHQLFIELKRLLANMDSPPYSHSGMSFKSNDGKFPDVKDASLRQFLYRARKKVSP